MLMEALELPASGSIETTLDVEQSGGIAPGAKIIVYQGANTNQHCRCGPNTESAADSISFHEL